MMSERQQTGWVLMSVFWMIATLTSAQEITPAASNDRLALSIPGEQLVPAALGVRNDSKGHSWNIEQNGNLGRVGSSMVNSGLQLVVDQEPFTTFQPRMTRDGKEFVIHSKGFEKLQGIQVARRVQFMDELGALRYLELFHNSSSSSRKLSIELITSFSGNYRSAITNRGNLDPLLLADDEVGVIVTPEALQANRGFLFTLCGTDAKDKPTISAQSRYGLKFQYQLELAPGETKAIAHIVSQVVVPDGLDKKTLSRLFEPYLLEANSTMPMFADVIANGSAKSSYNDPLLDSNGSFASLEVPQGDTDTLALGDKTRLFGEATIGRFTLRSNYGKTTFSSENIIAIAGKAQGLRDRVRVFLTDGQVLSGEVTDGSLEFTSNGSEKRSISFDKLDRLVLAKGAVSEKGEPNGFNEQATILTWNHDRLLLDGEDNLVFFGVSPWGELTFTLADLVRLIPAANQMPGYQVQLTDGTACRIFLSSRDVIVASEMLGELTLKGNQIKAVVPKQPQYVSNYLTKLRLSGNQNVAGELLDKTLSVYSEGQQLSVAVKEIRKISKVSSESENDPLNPKFTIELWDGSYIEGIVRKSALTVIVREDQWQLPLSDIIEINNPGPLLSADKRAKVSQMIADLGSDSWSEREQATKELIAFGKLMLPIVNRELTQNPDPEIRRRIERILDQFKERQ